MADRISKSCRMGLHRDCVNRKGADSWCPCPCHDFKVAAPEADPRYVKMLREEICRERTAAEDDGRRRINDLVVKLEDAQRALALAHEENARHISDKNELRRERRTMSEALDQQVSRTMELLREKGRIAGRLEEFERMYRAPRTNPKRSARRVELDDAEQAETEQGSEPPTGGDAPCG